MNNLTKQELDEYKYIKRKLKENNEKVDLIKGTANIRFNGGTYAQLGTGTGRAIANARAKLKLKKGFR